MNCFCFENYLCYLSMYRSAESLWAAPLKLRPYGAIQMCIWYYIYMACDCVVDLLWKLCQVWNVRRTKLCKLMLWTILYHKAKQTQQPHRHCATIFYRTKQLCYRGLGDRNSVRLSVSCRGADLFWTLGGRRVGALAPPRTAEGRAGGEYGRGSPLA